jgi:hypothetical protein
MEAEVLDSEHEHVDDDRRRASIDWSEVAHVALRSAVLAGIIGGALHVLGKAIETNAAEVDGAGHRDADAVDAQDDEVLDDDADELGVDDDEARAATLLGVSLDASEDQIRAALRAQLASSRLHPDHGGDEDEAKELIAAKNLLVERARARS